MHAQVHASFDATALESSARPAVSSRAVIPSGNDAAPIRFVAPDTATALAWRPYRLHIGTRLLLGRTDENGFTTQLSGAERAAVTDWEVE